MRTHRKILYVVTVFCYSFVTPWICLGLWRVTVEKYNGCGEFMWIGSDIQTGNFHLDSGLILSFLFLCIPCHKMECLGLWRHCKDNGCGMYMQNIDWGWHSYKEFPPRFPSYFIILYYFVFHVITWFDNECLCIVPIRYAWLRPCTRLRLLQCLWPWHNLACLWSVMQRSRFQSPKNYISK